MAFAGSSGTRCKAFHRILSKAQRPSCLRSRCFTSGNDEADDWTYKAPEGIDLPISDARTQPKPRQPRDYNEYDKRSKPGGGRPRAFLNPEAKSKLNKRSRDVEARWRNSAPDFPGFERALIEKDRVAAWLKFKDICFSDEKGRLTASQVAQVMALLVKHQPPKIALMDTTVSYAKQMGIKLDMSHYNLLIEANVKLRDFPSARKNLTEAIDAGLKPDLKITTNSSRYTLMKGMWKDTATFNSVMAAGMNARKKKVVLDYMEKLNASGLPPDQYTYDILIRTHANLGDIDAAEACYNEMLQKGIPANAKVLTWNLFLRKPLNKAWKWMYTSTPAIIHAYFKAKDTRSAVMKFEEMIESGCKPDITAFQNLIAGFCDMGLPTKAEEALVFMKSGRATVPLSIYRAVISGYLDARDGVRTLSVLPDDFDVELMSRYWEQWRESVEEQEAVAPPNPDVYSYTIVLEAYLRCSHIEKAHALLKEMLGKKFEPDSKSFIGLVDAHQSVVPVIRAHAAQFESLIMTLLSSSNALDSKGGISDIGPRRPMPATLREIAESGLDLRNVEEAATKRRVGIEIYRETGGRTSLDNFRESPSAWFDFIGPHPPTVTALLECVRDWGKLQTSRAVLHLVESENLPLDAEGRLVLACIMAKYGMVEELNRAVVDMVNAGIGMTPVIVRELEAYLKIGGVVREKVEEVMGFLEENWPEAFLLDEKA
ncbi:hypothetical protein BC829DRAFT_428952 [Chytridium lagenaria]|nr:hypothetical protein BC829DRAFT_428952 [Chytridium lagenaria]